MRENMPKDVAKVHFNVISIDRAIRFYRDVLGARLIDRPALVWVRMELDRMKIDLIVSSERAPYIQRGDFGSRGGATLTLRSTNIATDRQRLEKAGAVIFREENNFLGHYLLFEDSEGNVLRFLKPPRRTQKDEEGFQEAKTLESQFFW